MFELNFTDLLDAYHELLRVAKLIDGINSMRACVLITALWAVMVSLFG
jgi:hypothetical protein